MVEGLTSFSSPPMGSCRTVDPTSVGRKGALDDRDRSQKDSFAALTRITRTPAADHVITRMKILVTLAERPHPFPSRTRKLSSPAPKILRG